MGQEAHHLAEAQPIDSENLLRKESFQVNQVRYNQNSCYLTSSIQEIPTINATKFPASVMMLGVVGSDSKRMPPVWFPKGIKMCAPKNLNVPEMKLKPWLDGNYFFQQDGAPSHTAKRMQKWLGENPSNFWGSTHWPPSSPDLNLLDFGIWGVVEKRTCRTSHPNFEALKLLSTRSERT